MVPHVRRRRGHWERAPRSFEGEVLATEMRQEFKWTDSGRIWWWISHYYLEPPGELFDDIDTRGNRFNTHKLCKSKNHLVVRPDVAPQRWHNSVASRVLQTWLPQILILRDKKHKSCCSGAPWFPQAEPWTRQRLILANIVEEHPTCILTSKPTESAKFLQLNAVGAAIRL